MSKQSICDSKYFPVMITIIVIGMIFQIIRAGIDFGQWIYTIIL
jgi:hypothetical protein